ncbi:MAG TPA: hypothetical protein VFV03_09030 [Solirubrobacteraceae bacterium]|nr:hypothetical protein [Solirubrobacteraceae bacterium]
MASMLMDRPSTPGVERSLARWAPSPTIGRGELLGAILGGVALAVLTTWPLVLHMGSRIAPDLGDPVRSAWEVAWVGHALLHSPLHIFDSNSFYPHPLSLAFSDSLLGYGPAAFFGSGTVAALVRYNLLFLFAWSLCFLGAWLLARELGAGKVGATVAGAAFAYAPYRVTEAGHLHVISSGGIPLALFLLLRGYRRGTRALLAAGWLVAAWQVSLGFTLGLQFAYLLAVLALLAAIWWWRKRSRSTRRPSAGDASPRGVVASLRTLPRNLAAVTCIGVAVCGVVSVYQARPYLKVAADYPTAKRTLREVENYSSGPWAFLSASSENRVWGGVTAGARARVHSKNEDVFFPGAVIAALALVGLGAPIYTRRLRIGLACGAAACSILALGFGLTGAGYPYRLLYDFAPGWNGVRVPGRVFTLATLFLALLAAAGAWRLAEIARAWGAGLGPRGGERMMAVVGALLVVGLVGEGAGHLGHPVVPQPARAEIGLPAPILDLPTDGAADRVWQYFSTDGFPKIAQGNSTFDLPSQDDIRGGMNGFPDKASVEKLRWYGIRTVALHLKLPTLPGLHGNETAEPPDVVAAATKPVGGLGVTRRRVGDVVIYEIGPGPRALHGTD